MRLDRTRSMAASLLLICALIGFTVPQTACGPSDVHAVKVKLNDAAKILNTAAKSNHDLYESGVYGPAGSPQAIEKRQKVATAIHAANEGLIDALNVAKNIKADNVGPAKAQILQILSSATQALAAAHIGNDKIDLVIQAAAALINDAVILVTALKG